jgi:hypothetical protein
MIFFDFSCIREYSDDKKLDFLKYYAHNPTSGIRP